MAWWYSSCFANSRVLGSNPSVGSTLPRVICLSSASFRARIAASDLYAGTCKGNCDAERQAQGAALIAMLRNRLLAADHPQSHPIGFRQEPLGRTEKREHLNAGFRL